MRSKEHLLLKPTPLYSVNSTSQKGSLQYLTAMQINNKSLWFQNVVIHKILNDVFSEIHRNWILHLCWQLYMYWILICTKIHISDTSCSYGIKKETHSRIFHSKLKTYYPEILPTIDPHPTNQTAFMDSERQLNGFLFSFPLDLSVRFVHMIKSSLH